MLALPPERLDAALERLETTDRALLELSLKREVADAALAELMRLDATQVGRLRESALVRLAGELGVEPDDELAALLVDRRRSRSAPRLGEVEPPPEEPAAEEPAADEPIASEAQADDEPAVQEAVEPEQAEVERPGDHEQKSSRRGAIFLVAIVALLGIGVGIAVALLTGDDEETAQVEQPQPPPPEPPESREAPFRALSGAKGASGSARIVGEGREARLVLRVKGLPRAAGGYESWLYDSVTDAVPVGRLDGRDGTFQAKLPAEPGEYRFVDVSREPRDGNPNHSGASVLRAPMAPLLPKR